jgi:hypothetical protein
VAQPTENVGWGEANAGFDFGRVARFAWSRRQDANLVMRRHPGEAAVDLRVVERRLVDARLQIVGHHEPGAALKKSEHADMRADPVGQRRGDPHRKIRTPSGPRAGRATE